MTPTYEIGDRLTIKSILGNICDGGIIDGFLEALAEARIQGAQIMQIRAVNECDAKGVEYMAEAVETPESDKEDKLALGAMYHAVTDLSRTIEALPIPSNPYVDEEPCPSDCTECVS